MGIVSWLIVGIVAGWITSQVARRNVVASGVVGFIGAFAGGFAANLVGRDPVFGFTLISFFVAVLGSVVFLTVFSAVQRS